MMLVVMAALLRASYELSRQDRNSGIELLPQLTPRSDSGLTSWQREAADRAVKGYNAAQEKKWRHWNEAMFEPTK